MIVQSKETKRSIDWKKWKSGWKYKTDAPRDKQWQKDRLKLFTKHGNGWWWLKLKRSDYND